MSDGCLRLSIVGSCEKQPAGFGTSPRGVKNVLTVGGVFVLKEVQGCDTDCRRTSRRKLDMEPSAIFPCHRHGPGPLARRPPYVVPTGISSMPATEDFSFSSRQRIEERIRDRLAKLLRRNLAAQSLLRRQVSPGRVGPRRHSRTGRSQTSAVYDQGRTAGRAGKVPSYGRLTYRPNATVACARHQEQRADCSLHRGSTRPESWQRVLNCWQSFFDISRRQGRRSAAVSVFVRAVPGILVGVRRGEPWGWSLLAARPTRPRRPAAHDAG